MIKISLDKNSAITGEQNMKTDHIARAIKLRETLKKEDKILVADFSDTLQGKDTSRVIDLMPNVETGEYVFRAKVNIKQIDPLAAKEYGTDFFDVKQKSDSEIEAFVRKHEFDFPLWFKHDAGFEMKKVLDYNPPFILQVAGCNFHDGAETGGCWYCFVDDKSNDGKQGKGKAYLGTDPTIDSMLAAREKIKAQYAETGTDLSIKVLRLSGGEPTLALDWVLDLWRRIDERGLDFAGQMDSNLSTGSVVERFEKEGIYEKDILHKLAEYPVKVLTALKGNSEENLQENVQSTATMEEQLRSIKRFLSAGFDIYPQMYNPDPDKLKQYLAYMDRHIEDFSLRVHIGPLKMYGPNTHRLACEARLRGISPEELVAAKKTEWQENYVNGCEVIDEYLRQNYRVEYKQITRSDVRLRLRD